MQISYYKSDNLKYTSRKRYTSIDLVNGIIGTEVQKAVLVGDGAYTSIKTSAKYNCDYVVMTDNNNIFRWFVTYVKYLNSQQIILFLQRDVVGEKGLASCFGKIERGYADNVLKYRKELSLNQVLKERKSLIPNSFTYGNATVDTHLNEMWGVLYLVKPTGIDPSTGEPFPEKVNINIPSFAPKTVDYEYIPNGTIKNVLNYTRMNVSFNVSFYGESKKYQITIYFYPEDNKVSVWVKEVNSFQPYSISVNGNWAKPINDDTKKSILNALGESIGMAILNNQNSPDVEFKIPPKAPINDYSRDYNNIVLKKGEEFISYTITEQMSKLYGQTGDKYDFFNKTVKNLVNNKQFTYYVGNTSKTAVFNLSFPISVGSDNYVYLTSETEVTQKKYNEVLLTGAQSGGIIIDTTQQLVDEPYIEIVFPLFTTNLSIGGKTYDIKRESAFMIFNTVIQYLSGQNAYLIDAQIYPYCPTITGVSTELNNYPFLSISSNSYTHYCDVELLPYLDVKKEYIQREYTIISPEQTGRQTFNFYDYVNEFKESPIAGKNGAIMTIAIKTALKPYAIVSSAVIQPTLNSLRGITYESDLRGCQPSSNGFEVSLSSNAFESYKRQNSNYQQIFALQQEELQRNQRVEKVNEQASIVLNTLNATAMGAIAGGTISSGIPLPGAKSIGATAGGLTAGGVVGGLSAYQFSENEKLRAYEQELQQARFDLDIGTIKNLPNSINRISSFNEIILKSFWYVVEVYECTDEEKEIVNNFIENYGYSIGVYDFIENYKRNGWFLKAEIITSLYDMNLHEVLKNELKGGIYIYE